MGVSVGSGLDVRAGGRVVGADPVYRYVQRIARAAAVATPTRRPVKWPGPVHDDCVQLAEPMSGFDEGGADQRHQLLCVSEGVGDPLLRQQLDQSRFGRRSPAALPFRVDAAG